MHKKWIMAYAIIVYLSTHAMLHCGDQGNNQFHPIITTIFVTEPGMFSSEESKKRDVLIHEKHFNALTQKVLPGAISPIASPSPSPEKKAPAHPVRSQLNKSVFARDLFGAHFLMHEQHLDMLTNKPLPGATSPIASPFASPEKKTPAQSVHDRLRATSVARDLFGAKENKPQTTTDTELSESSKQFLDRYFATPTASLPTSIKKLRRNSWSDKEMVTDAAQQVALFAEETREAAQEFHMFDGVHKSWLEASNSLETLIADECDESSRGLVVLEARHASPLDLLEGLRSSQNRFGLSYKIAKDQKTSQKT